jgi:uracil-DNA glycosylase
MRQVKTCNMAHSAESSISEQITAALDWWREAGVDGDLLEAPQSWLTAEVPVVAQAADEPVPRRAPALAPAPAPTPSADRSQWPKDLTSFAPWWLAESWLDGGQTAARVAPQGPAQAELMILVKEPEREDSDTLLTGPQGRLLAGMLAAMGLERARVYLASALPRHTPHADWAAMQQRGIGEVLCHHIKLVAPKRLICFGSNILPLLGNDPANKTATLSKFNQESLHVPLLAARELAVLLERPRWKAGFWQNWLDWSADRVTADELGVEVTE